MALIDDIKVSLRVVSPKFDSEVEMLIGAALYDLGRVGVNPEILKLDEEGCLVEHLDREGKRSDLIVKMAVTSYCKANFGYDNDEASQFDEAYRRIAIDLANSFENVAAIEVAASEEEVSDGLGSERLVGEPDPQDDDGQ